MARILIVDDDIQVRKMLCKALERAGYETVAAPDGKVAMRLFRENPADLVITDLIMPEKEGIETIMELRRDFPQVKIIAISGGGIIEAEKYLYIAEKSGAQLTLAKPFTLRELLEAVQSLLEEREKS
jgi:DNA-binding response OmpR family regulator